MKRKILWVVISIIVLIWWVVGYYSRYEKNRLSQMRNRVIIESIKFDINQTIILTNQNLDRIIWHYRRNHFTKKIYWLPVQDNMKWQYLITWADYNTFVPLNFNIAKDKNTLYDSGKPIAISSQYNPRVIWWWQYIIDDNNVYVWYEALTWIDIKTFELIFTKKYDMKIPSNYSKDKNNLYFWWRIITGAEFKTFEALDTFYGKDIDKIYFFDTILSSIDYNSFKYIANTIFKDKNGVYQRNRLLTGVDKDSIEEVWYGYFKDKNNIYYLSHLIWSGLVIQTWIDYNSFEKIDDYRWLVKDKNHHYLNGKIYTGKWITHYK